MKLTATIKNFKKNIIGVFSSNNSKGLRVIPFSYLNNKTKVDDFTWNKFVKVEFAIKDFDNLLRRFTCENFVLSRIYTKCNIKLNANTTNNLFIDTSSYHDRIILSVFRIGHMEIVNDITLSQANTYLTNIIKTSLTNGVTSFNFIPGGSSNENSSEDILKALSCINVYYTV